MSVYGVLMAGGVGSRFWPRSRRRSPKQVLNITGQTSMIQETHKRLSGLIDDENIMVVTTADQQALLAEQLQMLSAQNFIIEPHGRNTAPCIGLGAIHALEQDPEAVMVVLPADHLVRDVAAFQQVINAAVEFVRENDTLVTLGITPTGPATGYGYIQRGDQVGEKQDRAVHRVKSFAEKPDLPTATRFLESGDFLWNSGMFIWRAATILDEMERQLPDIHEKLYDIRQTIGKADYQDTLERLYGSMKNISIDYGVMQEAENVFVIPSTIGWDDVGSWATVYDISEKDEKGNAGPCSQLISIDSANNYVYSPEKMVALVGLENLIVVETDDALLICERSKAQDVREIVDRLKKNGNEKLY